MAAVHLVGFAGERTDQDHAAAEMVQPFQNGQLDGDGMEPGQQTASVFLIREVAGMDIEARQDRGDIGEGDESCQNGKIQIERTEFFQQYLRNPKAMRSVSKKTAS